MGQIPRIKAGLTQSAGPDCPIAAIDNAMEIG